MEWSAAERGELGASLLSAPSAPHGGGGDVSKMLAEFVKIVAALKRARGALRLDAAWALAEAVQACLRPPHAQTLTKAQARDFRTAWNTLQALSDGGESKASTRPSPPPMEIDASQSTAGDRGDRRQQLQLQDDVDDSYELQLEEERTQEITRLNSQVSTVNQIYRDIASLVGNQQCALASRLRSASVRRTQTSTRPILGPRSTRSRTSLRKGTLAR